MKNLADITALVMVAWAVFVVACLRGWFDPPRRSRAYTVASREDCTVVTLTPNRQSLASRLGETETNSRRSLLLARRLLGVLLARDLLAGEVTKKDLDAVNRST
jgi:hypothetical protein